MGIFETVFPILAIVLTGFWAANRQYLSRADCDSIAKFVFVFVIPMLLFIGTVHSKIPSNMEWSFLFSYYAVLVFIFALSVFLAKVVFHFSAPEQSVFSMGASYSNATIVGLPVCIYALGENAMLPLFIIISIHNLILFTIGFIVAERDSFSMASFLRNSVGIVKQLVTSPITGSLILGGFINMFSIPIYKPLEDAITLMSKAAIPAALFVLGASLNKYKIHGHIAPALMIVVLKMIIFPVLVWTLVFQVFPVSKLWASTALLTSAMPVGISAYIFSQKYQVCEAPVATSIVISTVGSIVTLSFLIAYVQSVI
jgi:malonate transporter and related proteins